MVGTLIKEAWQLCLQPRFTAHSWDSYTGLGLFEMPTVTQ